MGARPNFDADTIEDAMGYLAHRIPELAAHGWKFIAGCSIGAAETGKHWGMLWEFRNDSYEYRYAIYVLKSRRGQGLLPKHIAKYPEMKFITIDDCNVADFYKKHGRDVLVLPSKT
jgi:hypothetical protein